MNNTIRPRLNADDDLEQLQEEFFAKRQVSSASVRHVAPPALGQSSKKKSIFAQRQQTKSQTAAKKHVESEDLSSMPDLEEADTTSQQVNEPHTPVSKNMLDLSSLLGNILGEVKENQSVSVEPPSIRKGEMRSQHHTQGFPKPARRSVFKQSMAIQHNNVHKSEDVNVSDYERDNMNRIETMSAEEIEEARKEIFSTLSSESISMLMNRDKGKKQHTGTDNQKTSKHDEELIMKHRMDNRFNINDEQSTNTEKLCRQLKFNYRGESFDSVVDPSSCQGLHNHSGDPDKASYTLEELFYMTRSHMPSQRAMALNTMACIIQRAKRDHADQIISIFRQVEQGPMFFIQSALDDKHLTVLVSAVKALAAIILDETEDTVDTIMDAGQFNEYLGYMSLPNRLQDKDDDDGAKTTTQDFIQSLINTDLLPRLRYLMLPNSELCQEDSASFERIVNILGKLARHGYEACKAIQDHQLLSSTLEWGILKRDWPMTQSDEVNSYPSLSVLQFLTVLAQGNRDVAATIASQATCLLQYLVTPPDVACSPLQNRAYALQVEALKLFQVLLRYGYVVPGFSDLHESIMGWLRISITEKTICNEARGVTAIRLLESSLHAAAKPHSTIPKHAIEWNQPIAFVPVILAVLRTSGSGTMHDAAMGYFATYVGYFNQFPSDDGEITIKHAWKTVIEDKTKLSYGGNTNSVLRYLQFLRAFSLIKGTTFQNINQAAMDYLKNAVDHVRSICQNGILGRLALWTWISSINNRRERIQLWGSEKAYDSAELEATTKSVRGCRLETGLARKFVQYCILDRLDSELVRVLHPFYLRETTKVDVVLDQEPVDVTTLTAPQSMPSTAASVTSWLFSPIDEVYHAEKNHTMQWDFESREVVTAVLEAASLLLEHVAIDHDVAIVSLMKIFLIGSRTQHDMKSDHEIFWDQRVSNWIRRWLDKLCVVHTEAPFAETIDDAWRRSSIYTRQSFYQFYQSFVAQYASTSFGERNFARLLAYITMEATDVVDYRYLLWNDYRDVLPTIKVNRKELPNMNYQGEVNPALVQAYLSAIMENNLSKEEDGNAMHHFAIRVLELSTASSLSPGLRRSIEQVLSKK
ncbi:hypothetical protein O0I10_008107 [Lichtheimia ornata]|uniref:RNA polymerase II-associated protein 1 C-terminal domain-containing protein n=1 Tax=Lichtheimia ornata TaxID=688661 RepID=A0AAD7UZ32_9FUNG|nr:uncharacterized protein O0I10_008107 [Lichtheimia ornata]KAJ8656313.1 hypothetical protein O0I10_008107 [Lichtheimia ornata]